MTVKLYHGDCLEILPTLEDGSIDAVITDPPYGTGEHIRLDGKLTKTRQSWDMWNTDWLHHYDGPLAMFCPPTRLQEGLTFTDRLLAWVSSNPVALKGVSPRYGIQPILARGPFPVNYGLDSV